MPTDLKTMLTAADSHDALVGIEHRDLPTLEPRDWQLREIAEKLWFAIKAERGEDITTSPFADRLVISRIRWELMKVRDTAGNDAACEAWRRTVELLK
jgi:hypothetical protein